MKVSVAMRAEINKRVVDLSNPVVEEGATANEVLQKCDFDSGIASAEKFGIPLERVSFVISFEEQ